MAQVTRDTVDVWRGWQRRELRIARCQSCGAWIHLPKRVCPQCWSDDVCAEIADGAGHLVAYSVPRSGGEGAAPVVCGVVALDHAPGVRILARIVACTPAEVRPGMALSVTWYEDATATVPAFEPAGAAQ